MGTISFTAPANLGAEAARELRRAYVTGGPDNFPLPTETSVRASEMLIRRLVEDSGYVAVPWELASLGRLLISTGTLMEREQPYGLRLELARGKIHLLRLMAAEGQERGRLALPTNLTQQILALTREFGHVLHQPVSATTEKQAQRLLEHAVQAAEQLALLQADERLVVRHRRFGPLDTLLGCVLDGYPLPEEQAALVADAFNSVVLRLNWKEVEPAESTYRWEPFDNLLAWAEANRLAITGGPLIDFSSARLPDWLWLWERDLGSIATFMCDYVATVLRRYGGRIQTWQLTAASNCGNVLSLGEDEREYLTIRLMEVARKIDPKLAIIVGLAQPWGEYMAQEDYTYSPLIFADTLVRSGLELGGLDLEILPAIWPRGSYCRDLLELARLVEMYRSLHVPLRLTIGYPAAAAPDALASADQKIDAGYWHGGFTSAVQAEWAAGISTVAVSEDPVRAVHWVQLSDDHPHPYPHTGLFDEQGKPRPALDQLRTVRQLHLR